MEKTKHDILQEICEELDIEFKDFYISSGSTITRDALIAIITAIKLNKQPTS